MSFDISEFNKPKTDQLNSEDILGSNLIIKITRVEKTGKPEQPLNFYFIGDNGKPYKPSKGMRRVIRAAWGKMSGNYTGKKIELFRDKDVKFGKLNVGGIRIAKMSDITNPEGFLTKEGKTYSIIITESQNKKALYQFDEMVSTEPSKPADAAIKKAGDEAAALGVAEYTAWLGKLSPEAKETARAFSKEWTAAAREADRLKAEETQSTDDGYPADTGEGDPEPT